MCHISTLQKLIGGLLALIFLAGYGPSTPTSPSLPASPPRAIQPLPSRAQPVSPAGLPPLFEPIRTVQVTPDAAFRVASFPRINYLPRSTSL